MGESVTVARLTLREADAIIERGKAAFLEVGAALLEVQDRRLYEDGGYSTFEDYMQQRHGISRQHGYRLIDAAKVQALVSPIGDIPSEAVARELASLAKKDPEAAQAVWHEAVETAPNGKVTADHVGDIVDRHTDNDPVPEPEPEPEPADKHKVHYSSESAEWYTPADILDRAGRVMLGIDLDPCADPGRQVPAQQHFTADDDGLSQEWPAVSVWMNPPYGREIAPWVAKWIAHVEHSEGMALLPARTDTDWFQPLFRAGVSFCFIDGRLKFSGHKNSAPFPSVIVYRGDNLRGFFDEFRTVGGIVESGIAPSEEA